jgi:hypothetical protein
MKTEPLRPGEQFSVRQAVPFEVNFKQTNREISHRLGFSKNTVVDIVKRIARRRR